MNSFPQPLHLKFSFFLGALLVFGISTSAQINAENGLTSPGGTTVQLGGSLIQSTSIDMGNSYDLNFHKSGTKYFTIKNNGNIGLGDGDPGARLSLPNVEYNNDPTGITWYSPSPLVCGIHKTAGPWTGPDYQQLRLSWLTGIILDPGTIYGKSYVDITGGGLRVTSGNVGIGITNVANSSYKLLVNGDVRARKIKVDQDTWPDYVFENNYRLRPLKEVEQFIHNEKHLPDVPSAREVKQEGLDLGDNQATLLQKIEELTLYIIQQQKQLDAQQKRIDTLEKKNGKQIE